ncbi:DEDD exonuclease domain-containing protein [Buchananella hordeovulneris]|uniref:DEDD exonuclease domain-containing protein n=1 Tax=Buchananella hordeovulneris TaxID=52770 RepID=UPI001FEE9EFB|nr:DEDD exonuclease domain-containing protein [Buchananella hordeovulneris]
MVRDPFELAGDPHSDGPALQLSLQGLSTPLAEVTFVVVDLETTGTSAHRHAITEIGAVKVRGGEVLGEFGTLVNPGTSIQPQITALTGITNAMVATAPPLASAYPAFLEFAGLDRADTVLVAHNAPFDVGFLKAAAATLGYDWPQPLILDTVTLARRSLRGQVPNHRLATLARYFGAATTPNHRALDDARATVDVLHGLLEQLAPLGVTHLADLPHAADPVPARRRRKSRLADQLPTSPGVYLFVDAAEQVLYVGAATCLRSRVRSYFTAAEKRSLIGPMLDLAHAVRHIECATALEAHVQELRLIAELSPPYNRRSKHPHRQKWLALTAETHPRLTLTRNVPLADVERAIGPFAGRRAGELAAAALTDLVPLRRCTTRLPAAPTAAAQACPLLELRKCLAPCLPAAARPAWTHCQSDPVATAVSMLAHTPAALILPTLRQIRQLAEQLRYEEAGQVTTRLAAFVRGAARAEQLRPLFAADQIVAARRREGGGWELVVIRYGRLAAVGVSGPGEDPRPLVAHLQATAEPVPAPTRVGGAASAEETGLLAAWLYAPGTRLVEVAGAVPLAVSISGASRHLTLLAGSPAD